MWFVSRDDVWRIDRVKLSFDAYYAYFDLISICEGKFSMLSCDAIYGYICDL